MLMIRKQIEEIIGLDTSIAVDISAKTGLNVAAVLQQVIDFIPPPPDNGDKPLRALIFDSWYDNYRGVVMLVRVMDGSMRKGSKLWMNATEKQYDVLEVGADVHGDADRPGRQGFDREQALHAGQVADPHAQIVAVLDDFRRAIAIDDVDDVTRDAILAAVEKENPLERMALVARDSRREFDSPHVTQPRPHDGPRTEEWRIMLAAAALCRADQPLFVAAAPQKALGSRPAGIGYFYELLHVFGMVRWSVKPTSRAMHQPCCASSAAASSSPS